MKRYPFMNLYIFGLSNTRPTLCICTIPIYGFSTLIAVFSSSALGRIFQFYCRKIQLICERGRKHNHTDIRERFYMQQYYYIRILASHKNDV